MKKALFSAIEVKEMLLRFFSGVTGGVYIDGGGNIPESCVSLPFHEMGWTGVVVEPIPENVKKLRDSGRKDVWQGAVSSPEKAAKGFATLYLAGGKLGQHSSLNNENLASRHEPGSELTVAISTVKELCEEFGIVTADLLSVDTEGTEADVLLGSNLQKLSPKLILVEDWVLNLSVHNLLKKNGYRLVRRTGYNSWYVRTRDGFPMSLFGHFQLIRKYYLGLPFRQIKRLVKSSLLKP